MSTALPLIVHTPDAPIAYRAQRCIYAREFLADVAQLCTLLPTGKHVLNVCADRYRFTVGLAAAMCTGKICLLPSTHTPESVRQLRAFAPDVFCLTDHAVAIDLPQLHYPDNAPIPVQNNYAVPQIAAEQIVAYVFTSGSTGVPIGHAKIWRNLVGGVRAEAARLAIDGDRNYTIVGTVPPQHMYGFESTVLLAMQSGAAFWCGKPFYAADIAAALAAVPAPRILVSTPFHLRTFIDAQTFAETQSGNPQLQCPELQCVMSATAPLTNSAARAIEATCNAPLLEIYGSTESGQIASRRSANETHWRLLDGLHLQQRGQKTFVAGDFIEASVELGDIIELHAGGEFSLIGRHSDLINIAGKRTSLGFLNHQLLAIDGVKDGVFFLPDENGDGITRLIAFVVAPKLDSKMILQALRERIDPLFLPRPLFFVTQLPRNAAGKLPRAALLALWQSEREKKAALPHEKNAQGETGELSYPNTKQREAR